MDILTTHNASDTPEPGALRPYDPDKFVPPKPWAPVEMDSRIVAQVEATYGKGIRLAEYKP